MIHPVLAKKPIFHHTSAMLNSRKLLYIFSDVAYIAELLPAKKDGDFTVQSFRQINGEFLNNDVFLAENIEKLFSKIEPEEYTLVLPDSFFTNTIVEVNEKAKSKVDKYITDELLPSLGISQDSHQVEHFGLTQYGEKSNVQLSALEKSLIAPIYESASNHGVKIDKIVSLSWTIKSLISLEPSLSLVQMGERLYLVQHYIGIDQANWSEVADVEKIAETIKTLKGAQPSLQTAYLLTNELVEAKLKDLLKSTLPIQQLSDFKDEKSEMPSYVKQVIEAGAKTLSVDSFNVPTFKLEKFEGVVPMQAKAKQDDEDEDEGEVGDADEKDVAEDKSEDLPLPEPSTPPALVDGATLPSATALPDVETAKESETALPETAEPDVLTPDTATPIVATPDVTTTPDVAVPVKSVDTATPAEPVKSVDSSDTAKPTMTSELVKPIVTDQPATPAKPTQSVEPIKSTPSNVIKNKTGVGPMLKMIFISVSVFFVTVGVGVGLGLGYLAISGEKQPTEIVESSPTPTPEPTPTPTPEPEINKEEIKILVVNATTKAGYAGTIQDLIEENGFTDVDAANARGDYEDGNYVLMTEENSALIKLLEEATELSFEYSSDIEVEDLKGSYDAVVVLAQ